MRCRHFYKADKAVTFLVDEQPLSVFQVKAVNVLALLGMQSVRVACDAKHTPLAYVHDEVTDKRIFSPYGDSVQPFVYPLFPAYNGEMLDSASGKYALGNGRRLYAASLMRFVSPDVQSPFSVGGANAYAYCQSDPINFSDPSGQFRIGRMKPSAWFKWPFNKRPKFKKAVVEEAIRDISYMLISTVPEGREFLNNREAARGLRSKVLDLNISAASMKSRGGQYDSLLADLNIVPFILDKNNISYPAQINIFKSEERFLSAYLTRRRDTEITELAAGLVSQLERIRSGGRTPGAGHRR